MELRFDTKYWLQTNVLRLEDFFQCELVLIRYGCIWTQ